MSEALRELLACGDGPPGAGSAAAVTVAIAAALVQGHAALTVERGGGGAEKLSFVPRAREIATAAESLVNRARQAALDDAAGFAPVLQARELRDGAMGEAREAAAREAAEALATATWVGVETGRMAFEVAELGLELHEHGRRSAKGEAVAAVLLAVAAAEGALALVAINLSSLADSPAEAGLLVALQDLRARAAGLSDRSRGLLPPTLRR